MPTLRSIIIAGIALVCGAVFAVWAGTSWAQEQPADFSLRGQPADPKTFALATLYSPTQRAELDAIRGAAFDSCMNVRGFKEPPAEADSAEAKTAEAKLYEQRFAMAATGDDLTRSVPPPPQKVRLPDGSTTEVDVTWTKDTCMYAAFARLGSDAIYREALRMRIMMLRIQADTETGESLQDVVSNWKSCVGLDQANIFDVLRTIDGEPTHAGAPPIDKSCLSGGEISQIREVRAQHNLAVAAANKEVVDAWVSLVDKELAAARSSS